MKQVAVPITTSDTHISCEHISQSRETWFLYAEKGYCVTETQSDFEAGYASLYEHVNPMFIANRCV